MSVFCLLYSFLNQFFFTYINLTLIPVHVMVSWDTFSVLAHLFHVNSELLPYTLVYEHTYI